MKSYDEMVKKAAEWYALAKSENGNSRDLDRAYGYCGAVCDMFGKSIVEVVQDVRRLCESGEY